MSTVRAHYEAARASGQSRREAKRSALQQAIIDAEREQLDKGFDEYGQEEVNQAIVHTRQDTVLVMAHLGEIADNTRSIRRWLIGIAVLLFLLVLHFLA
jgi:hypothetical protein